MAIEKPEIYYLNRLDGATVTASTNNDNVWLLYNYSKLYPWIAGSTAAQNVLIRLGSSLACDCVIIENQNAVGATWELRASTDNFSASNVLIDSWQQMTAGNILRRFTSASYPDWKVNISSGGTWEIGEMYLGESAQLPKNPVIPFDHESDIDKSLVSRSDRGYKTALDRFKLKYFQLNFGEHYLAEYNNAFLDWWIECGCVKPFYFCFRPDTEPENICLVRNTTTDFNSIISGRFRMPFSFLFEEVR